MTEAFVRASARPPTAARPGRVQFAETTPDGQPRETRVERSARRTNELARSLRILIAALGDRSEFVIVWKAPPFQALTIFIGDESVMRVERATFAGWKRHGWICDVAKDGGWITMAITDSGEEELKRAG